MIEFMKNLIVTLDEVEPAEAEDDDLRAVHPLHTGWGATKQAPPTHLNSHLLDLREKNYEKKFQPYSGI